MIKIKLNFNRIFTIGTQNVATGNNSFAGGFHLLPNIMMKSYILSL